jgi:carbon-monoxide dehydrogenase medium subunit
MKPAAFGYLRPTSIEEALTQLAAGGAAAKLIAGGQSLGPMMNMRLATPSQLIDLNDLTELACIRDAGEWLEIGALARHHQIASSAVVQRDCPLLAQAAQTIGHYAIRQRGTLGGSLAHADPAAQLPLVAVTLGARLNLVSASSRRSVPAHEFFLAAMTTALEGDELIASIEFPKAVAGEAASFKMFNRRHGDYAIVAAATTVQVEDGKVKRVRLGLGGVAPMPRCLDEVIAPFLGGTPDEQWVARVAAAVRQAVAPDDDTRISALYRRELAQTLVARALARATGQLQDHP